jgi:hypothetical protein
LDLFSWGTVLIILVVYIIEHMYVLWTVSLLL